MNIPETIPTNSQHYHCICFSNSSNLTRFEQKRETPTECKNVTLPIQKSKSTDVNINLKTK